MFMLVLDFVKCLAKVKITDMTFFQGLKYINYINKIVINDVNVNLKARISWNQRWLHGNWMVKDKGS